MTSSIKCQLFSFVVCVIGAATAAAVGKLPPNFTKCKVKDPNFNQCMGGAVEHALKVLTDGYAPLGIFPFDPLKITAIDIDQGSGPVSINLKFRDLLIKGLNTAKISDFKSDMNKLTLTAKAYIKKVDLDGQYSIDGKVLILPINGEGPSKLSLDDITADVTIQGTRVQKGGETYMKVTKFDFNLEAEKMEIKLDNLFKGDKALGNNMNLFLNENWSEILNELKPAIQDTFGLAFAEIANRIFTKVPLNEIFEGIDS